MLRKIKSYMMPIAMIVGGVFYKYVSALSSITPWLIAIMLFITYRNISMRDIRLSRLHYWLLSLQIIGSVLVYFLLNPFSTIVAQGAMICILAPTATSAPVITKMLGGNTESLMAYSLLSNMAVVLFAPFIFSYIGNDHSIDFVVALWTITRKIAFLLLLPFFCALLLKRILPRVHYAIRSKQSVSFYLWSLALIIITGKTVDFIIHQQHADYLVQVITSLAALVVCVSQFWTGRRLGRIYDDTVAGGQGLGQKNTILAIWLAQNYLSPISSIGPGAYILWQNIINSYQLWRQRRRL